VLCERAVWEGLVGGLEKGAGKMVECCLGPLDFEFEYEVGCTSESFTA